MVNSKTPEDQKVPSRDPLTSTERAMIEIREREEAELGGMIPSMVEQIIQDGQDRKSREANKNKRDEEEKDNIIVR